MEALTETVSAGDVPHWLSTAEKALATMQSDTAELTAASEPPPCITLTCDQFDSALHLVNAKLNEIDLKLFQLLAMRNQAPAEPVHVIGDTSRSLRKSKRGSISAPPNSRSLMSHRRY